MDLTTILPISAVPPPRPEKPRVLLPGQEPSRDSGSEVIMSPRDPDALVKQGAITPSGLVVPLDAMEALAPKPELKWIGQKIGVVAVGRIEIKAAGIMVRGRQKDNDQRRALIKEATVANHPRLLKYKSALLLGSGEVIVGPAVAEARKIDRKNIQFLYETWILLGPLQIEELWILSPERRYMLRWVHDFAIDTGEQKQYTPCIKFGLPDAVRRTQ